MIWLLSSDQSLSNANYYLRFSPSAVCCCFKPYLSLNKIAKVKYKLDNRITESRIKLNWPSFHKTPCICSFIPIRVKAQKLAMFMIVLYFFSFYGNKNKIKTLLLKTQTSLMLIEEVEEFCKMQRKFMWIFTEESLA